MGLRVGDGGGGGQLGFRQPFAQRDALPLLVVALAASRGVVVIAPRQVRGPCARRAGPTAGARSPRVGSTPRRLRPFRRRRATLPSPAVPSPSRPRRRSLLFEAPPLSSPRRRASPRAPSPGAGARPRARASRPFPRAPPPPARRLPAAAARRPTASESFSSRFSHPAFDVVRRVSQRVVHLGVDRGVERGVVARAPMTPRTSRSRSSVSTSDARFARSDARSDSNLARSDARSDSNLDATSRSRAARGHLRRVRGLAPRALDRVLDAAVALPRARVGSNPRRLCDVSRPPPRRTRAPPRLSSRSPLRASRRRTAPLRDRCGVDRRDALRGRGVDVAFQTSQVERRLVALRPRGRSSL